MTQNEMIVMRDLLGDIIEANSERTRIEKELAGKSDVNERQEKEYASLCIECNQLRERLKDLQNASDAWEQRVKDVLAERDDARRKLGALVLCVGFLKDYDSRHPTRSLETFKAAVKKCINENHIVLTEGGMAK